MAGWDQGNLTINDYAAYGAKLRELAGRSGSPFYMTVAEFREHFGTSATVEGEHVNDEMRVTFQRPEPDNGSVLTIYLPWGSDIDNMASNDPGKGPYELPDFYQEIFVKPVYSDLSDGPARERVRNARLAEYTTNKCH